MELPMELGKDQWGACESLCLALCSNWSGRICFTALSFVSSVLCGKSTFNGECKCLLVFAEFETLLHCDSWGKNSIQFTCLHLPSTQCPSPREAQTMLGWVTFFLFLSVRNWSHLSTPTAFSVCFCLSFAQKPQGDKFLSSKIFYSSP